MMFSFVVHCVDSEFRFQDLLSGGGRCKSSSSVSTHRMAIIFCFLLTTTYRGGGNGGRGHSPAHPLILQESKRQQKEKETIYHCSPSRFLNIPPPLYIVPTSLENGLFFLKKTDSAHNL